MPEQTDPVPTPESPHYEALESAADGDYFVTVNEGWRSSIVCTGMYQWAARWLVEQLQRRPFATNTRPGGADHA